MGMQVCMMHPPNGATLYNNLLAGEKIPPASLSISYIECGSRRDKKRMARRVCWLLLFSKPGLAIS